VRGFLTPALESGVANQGVLNPSLATPDSGVFNPESGEETADLVCCFTVGAS
jgi:hypothetical protein